ncbi:MAG: efflux RND transporter permease subunit [Planctomycetota bacterium]|nr:efflux RND transporter permease subunit [Planctomycetota bacterium]
MNLPKFSVRNPVAVNLLMVAVIAGGAAALMFGLVREFFPSMEAEQVFITVPYPGATPEEIERSVTRLIEREIEDVDDIKEIRSRVFEGATIVTAVLEQGADRDSVISDIRGEIDKVVPSLPDGAEEPAILEARPNIPVIAVVLHGDVPEHQLHEATLRVRDELLDLPAISELIITGFRRRELAIEILPDRLDEFGLTFEQVGRAVAALNRDVPGGQLKGGDAYVRVRTMGEEQTPEQLEAKIILTTQDGSIVRVSDIGRVRPTFEDKTEKGRFDGRAAVQLFVFKTPEQDAIAIAGAVRDYVASNPQMLGGALKLDTTTDLSRIIEGRIDLMQRNAIMGLVLLLIALALFLELRVAFWVAVGLGFSFMGTFIVMWATGQTINMISLFGLIVVLGLIVDDAIVIAENIFRKKREGMPAIEAAVDGAEKVTLPVVAAVLTTIAAFLPLAFMEGRMGTFLGVMPKVVMCALAVSLIEAFLILPCHLAHDPKPRAAPGRLRQKLDQIGQLRHRVFEGWLPDLLERQLRFLLRWRYAAAGVALALLPIAGGLIVGGQLPFVFLPNVDAETISAKLEMAAGTPEEITADTLARIGALARQEPEVDTVFSVLGASFGERGRETASDPAVVGQITIELLPADKREAEGLRTSRDLLTQFRAASAALPGVRRLSFLAQAGGPSGPDLEIRVRGEDLDQLQEAVVWARGQIASFEGIEEMYDDLELGKLEARMSLREDARLLGLTTQDVAMQLRHALFGFEVQDLQIGDDEVTIRVMLPPSERRTLDDLGRLWIALPAGGRVPLAEAATFTTDRGYASLARVDGKRSATIKAEVDESRANVAQVTEAIREATATIGDQFPGVTLTFEGRRKETRESTGSLGYLFPIALLFIYVIIAVVFRSYVQPIIVMSIIPFALIGAVIGHLVMGFPMTLLSMLGIVALAGIVVNDGLILVDLANRRRREGLPLFEAVIAAARGRMRPILLTSITTCAGLAPIMLETSFQAQFLIPMAVSIVFGLGFATGLILLLLPVAYMITEDLRAGGRWLFGHRWAHHMPHDPGVELGADHT